MWRVEGCVDVDGMADCQLIANNQLCHLARDYMFCHCRQRCGLCLTQQPNITCSNHSPLITIIPIALLCRRALKTKVNDVNVF